MLPRFFERFGKTTSFEGPARRVVHGVDTEFKKTNRRAGTSVADCQSARAAPLRIGAVPVAAAALVLALAACASSQAPAPAAHATLAEAPSNSPKGSLLIVGGGPIPDEILDRFVALAGGAGRARIVIFPMASSSADAGVELAGDFQKRGAEAERIVLTHEQADSEDAARRLEGVTGIWFGGGDQVLLTRALSHTRVEAAIRRRYLEGAVVGGTSAGAAVMSTPMITGDEKHPGGSRPPAKDSSDAFMTIARENIVTQDGFALLPGAIVDQHFIRRRRHNRLISLVLENPTLVGVGIDESTAVEVEPGGRWRVLGESVAFVVDARQASITGAGHGALGADGVKLSVLPAGSTYERASGKATLPSPESPRRP
jgi:cyanophycinase